MKEKIVIFKCDVDAIDDVREHLDAIASMTNGTVWFETISHAVAGYYNIICHYDESKFSWEDRTVKEDNAHIDTLYSEITAIDDRVASVEGEVEAIKDSIGSENIKIDLDNAYTDLDIVQDKMKTIETDLDDCKRRYFNDKQELQEQLDKDFDDVYTEFSNVKDSVNDINFGYIKWSAEVSQFDERIEKLEDNMKEISANGGLGCSFNLMNERISSNKRDISSLRNAIGDLDRKLDDYKESYMHLNNADEAFDRRIKALERAFKGQADQNLNVNRRIDALEASIHKLEESFSVIADDNLSLNAIFSKNNEDIDRLEELCDAMSSEIAATKDNMKDMKFELSENTKVIADLAENNIKNRKLEKEIRGIKTRLESDEEIFNNQLNRIAEMRDCIGNTQSNLVHQTERINANITSLIDLESRVKTLESKKTTKKND